MRLIDIEIPTASLQLMNQEFAKLDQFDGQNYTRWFDKVKFMLHVLMPSYVLDPNLTVISVDPISEVGKTVDRNLISNLEKQKALRRESEELCVGYIKNFLSNRLYDLYASFTDLTNLWKALEL
uniref:Uncharacterized protein n=1 Tax=Lactuca sativa TaxID=4236 RepID=A0A9R1XC46_LACSA|nr:hypothetical protein LSAT_V11C400163720 [Lactuca sativa]